MGFYRPATLVKDAQRHGLKVLPIDAMKSEWQCTLETVSGFQFPVSSSCPTTRNQKLETGNSSVALRLGLRYARGLREEAGQALVRQRSLSPFTSIGGLIHRVPELRKDELNTLAEIGALNSVSSFQSPAQLGQRPFSACPERREGTNDQRPNWKLHRRDALWQVERAVRHSGPLLDSLSEPDAKSPLRPMNAEERLVADFRGTGMTVGPHPMAYHRARMKALGVHQAIDLKKIPSGRLLRIGGCVIARQRPGTAKGFVFLSLEDETGVANAIVNPDLFQQNRLLLSSEQFLMIEGVLQNQDNVISVKAQRVSPLHITRAETSSHDFY
jgi:error-prone DNA polymerase